MRGVSDLSARQILELVHDRFYSAWEKYKSEDEARHGKRKHGKRSEAQREYDVRVRLASRDICYSR